MTTLRDGLGRAVALPDDLRVALCHLCDRWAAGDRGNAGHQTLVRSMAKRGLVMRLAKDRVAGRPVCVGCHRIHQRLEACA